MRPQPEAAGWRLALTPGRALGLVLLGGLALRLLIAYVWLPGEGLGSDLRLFTRWADTLSGYGTGAFYSHAGFADYTPGYMYVLWVIGRAGNMMAGLTGQAPSEAIMPLVKLPAIVADLLIAVLLYQAASRWRDSRAGLIAAAIFLFIPVTWYESALWGQVDAVGTLMLLGGLLLLIGGWSEPAVAMAVLAALTKPQYAIGLGIIGAVLLKRHLFRPGSGPVPEVRGFTARLDLRLGGWFTQRQGFLRLISCAVVAAAVGLAVILPFDLPSKAPADLAGTPILGHVAGLVAVIGSAASFYTVLTVNSFNLWALVGPTPLSHQMGHDYFWTLDSLPFLGDVPAVAVGAALLAVAALMAAAAVILRDDRRGVLLAFTMLAVAFFVLPTRVHERYMFPAFATGALLAATSVRWRWWVVALGLVNVANLHAVLTLDHEGYGTPAVQALPFGALLRDDISVVVIALLHTALFVVVLTALLRSTPWASAWSLVRRPIQVGEPAVSEAAPEAAEPARRPPAPRRSTPGPATAPRAGPRWPSLAVLPSPLRRLLQADLVPPDTTAALASEGGGRLDRRDLLVVAVLLVATLGMRTWRLDTPSNMYFDEDFHARSAMEFLQDWRYGIPHDISEDTHPHLAKYLIAGGLAALGDNRLSSIVLVGTETRGAAVQEAFVQASGTLDGDRIAIATDAGVRVALSGDIEGAQEMPLAGAASVAFDPDADRLYVGTDDGRVYSLNAKAMLGDGTPADIGRVNGSVTRLWAVGGGRLMVSSGDDRLSLMDTNTGSIAGSRRVAGVTDLVAFPTENSTLLVAAVPEGIAVLDPVTLAPTIRVPLASVPRGMALVDGSDFARRNRDMLSVPTLYVATAGSRMEMVTAGPLGELASAGGFAMPGDVRDVRWNFRSNLVHVLGTAPGGATTIYVVEPNGNAVFADAEIPFNPVAWVLDAQPHAPSLDREHALAFAATGTVAVVNIGGNAFAWRFPGVVAGSLMVALLYLLARILFRRRTVGLLLAPMLALEGLLFSQSRIAMNDAFVGLFIVAALTLLAALMWTTATGARARLISILGLPTVGLLLGLALSSKWVGAYAIGAAVLLVLLRSWAGRWLALSGMLTLTAVLGWQAIAGQPANVAFLVLMVALTSLLLVGIVRPPMVDEPRPSWLNPRRAFGIPFGLAMVCLIAVPLAVYVLSYVPWALTAGGDPRLISGWPPGHTGQTFADLQAQMYAFHNDLRIQHGAASPWWAWPLGLKPVWGAFERFADGTDAMVFGVGNPTLLWLSVVGVGFGIWQAWRRRTQGLTFAVIVFLAAWLPWVRIDRFVLNYHYYVALPFALLLLAYFLAEVWEGPSRLTWVVARMSFAVVLLMPTLLWLLKDVLCGVGGVGQTNPSAFVCTDSILTVGLPLLGWTIGALTLGWITIRWLDHRRWVIVVLGVAGATFVAFYPALSAMQLPAGWPFVFQGLLPTWEGAFQFSSNLVPAVRVPLFGIGPVAVLLLTAGSAWAVLLVIRRRPHPPGAIEPYPEPPPPAPFTTKREVRAEGDSKMVETATSSEVVDASPLARVASAPPRSRASPVTLPGIPRPTFVFPPLGSLAVWQRISAVRPGLWAMVGVLALTSFVGAILAARFAGFGGPWLWNTDMPLINYPFAGFFHQALAGGSLPLWQDSLGMGLPIYAEGQVGALYPPHWMIYQLPPLIALDVSRILHLTLAGTGAGLITLRLAGSRTGSVVTALIAVLCGGITGKLMATEMVVAYGWVPWVLLPLLWRRGGPTGRAVAVAAIPWGIQALAGHPQTWVLTGICAVVVILTTLPIRRGLVRVLAFGALGVGVGAAQLLPTALLTTLSTRSGGLAPASLFQYSATPFDFLGVPFANAFAPAGSPSWNPNLTWYPGGGFATLEVYAFVGMAGLALAVVGLTSRRARPLLVVAAAMILIPIIGVFQPALWAAIPGLNGLRHPVRGYMLVDVAIAVAAGIGVARLGSVRTMRAPVVVLGVAVAGYLAIAAFVVLAPQAFESLVAALWSYPPPGHEAEVRQAAFDALTQPWPIALELVLGVAAILLIRSSGRALVTRLAAVALVGIPLLLFSPAINQSRTEDSFSSRNTSWMQALRDVQPNVVAIDPDHGYLYHNQLALEGIRDLDVFSSLGLSASAELQDAIGTHPESDLGKAVGIDTTLSFGAPCIGQELVYDPGSEAHICHLEGALRAPYWLPAGAVAISDVTGSPIQPIDAQVDATLILGQAVPASIESWDAGQAQLRVTAPANGYLFINRSWWPGWQVYVDGRRVLPYRAWSGQLVPVTAGSHRIEQRLLPWDAVIGGMVSLLTGLWVAIGLFLTRTGTPSPRLTLRRGGSARWRRTSDGRVDESPAVIAIDSQPPVTLSDEPIPEEPELPSAPPGRRLTRRRFIIGAVAALAVAALGGVWQSGILYGKWRKDARNPVLGGALGTVFDVSVISHAGHYEMWFSWRPRASIAFCKSSDGVSWTEPEIVLAPNPASGWEDIVDRPVVLIRDGRYHMWYSGHNANGSQIGYATSGDGRSWTRAIAGPVLSPTQPWEKSAVMCPHVVWDDRRHHFRMWYSGGEIREPNAIGHAVSNDGITWAKEASNPVFVHGEAGTWDADRVTACHVEQTDRDYLMFYIGFTDVEHAQIGLARSLDGVTGWERHPLNPIVRRGEESAWDADAVYKPSVVREDGRWMLWYNGRRGDVEQIGLAVHDGGDLFF